MRENELWIPEIFKNKKEKVLYINHTKIKKIKIKIVFKIN